MYVLDVPSHQPIIQGKDYYYSKSKNTTKSTQIKRPTQTSIMVINLEREGQNAQPQQKRFKIVKSVMHLTKSVPVDKLIGGMPKHSG